VYQTPQPPNPLQDNSSGPDATFEVATIKPADPDAAAVSFTQSSDSILIRHASLRDLIQFGWGLKNVDQVEQGPAWDRTNYYDVSAKISDSDAAALKNLDREARFEARRRMLQALVIDRFHVQATSTSQIRPVYALVVARGGPRLTKSAPSTAGANDASSASHPSLRFREDHLIAQCYSMAIFAEWLSSQPAVDRRIVVDQTGLTGNYDFSLDGWYAREERPLDPVNPEQDQGKSLFAVLEQQLGLKLVPAKAPVPVVIVEHAEPPPPN
jgi:uncharacterized protein (TIGR03435 family)